MFNLVMQKNPKSPTAEAFRTLKTNIQFASFDKPVQTILVTSPGPSEGKSTTAANLAIAMSEGGKCVILIDCDLRKPSVHRKFKISNQKGLSGVLAGEYDLSEASTKLSDSLTVLTTGILPPNPVELISSIKMKKFLLDLKADYDYIIIDTPPVLAVTDAQLLSTYADGTILVVSSGETDKNAIIKAKSLLDNVKAKIIGIVLNKLDAKHGKRYGRSGYYGYYYYYGTEGKKERRSKK